MNDLDPTTYELEPSQDIPNPADFIKQMQVAGRNDRHAAFLKLAVVWPLLPALLIYDVLDQRVEVTGEPENFASITWDGPLSQDTNDYLYNWKGLAFVVADPKLGWIEAILDDKKIPHRRVTQERRETPRLEVPVECFKDASKIWTFKIQGNDKYIKDIPSDDPVFQEGGAGWSADLVDEDPNRPIETDKNA